MHVLVTRPIQDSFEIILELKKRSYDFTHIPLLKIDYLNVKEINGEQQNARGHMMVQENVSLID